MGEMEVGNGAKGSHDARDPHARRGFRLGLLLGWLLILGYLAWVLHNVYSLLSATTALAPGDFVTQALSLPPSPAPLAAVTSPTVSVTLSPMLAACMLFLALLLIVLTFIPLPDDALPSHRDHRDEAHDTYRPASRLALSPTPADAADAADAAIAPQIMTPPINSPTTPPPSQMRRTNVKQSPESAEDSARSANTPSRADTGSMAIVIPPPDVTPFLTGPSTSLDRAHVPSVSAAAAASASISSGPASASRGSAADSSAYIARVFISHSSHDDDFGKQLVADLRAKLAPDDPDRVWYDHAAARDLTVDDSSVGAGGLEVGDNFVGGIVAELDARNVFIFLLSPDAVRSRWVRYEIQKAIQRYNGPTPVAIYPVICQPCPLPDALTIFQAIDLSQRDTDPTAYEINLQTLISRVIHNSVAMSDAPPPFEFGVLPLPYEFVGRVDELTWALDRLRHGGPAGITALRGIAGIGKTALAAAIIRKLHQEQAFPDGIVVVDCFNLTDPVEVLRHALTPFLPGRKAPQASDLAALSAIAYQHMRNKRALIVFDSVEPDWKVEQAIEPLRTIGLTLLLTARQSLSTDAVPAEGMRELKLLSPDEALLLFAHSFGRRDTDELTSEECAQAKVIIELVERHTLAVKLAGASAAIPPRPLDKVVDELRSDLLMLPADDESSRLDAILGRSIESLPDDEQRLFAAITAFLRPTLDDHPESGSNEFGNEALKALAAALGIQNVTSSANLLVRRALVEALPIADLPDLPSTADRERRRLHALLQAASATRYRKLTATERQQAQRALATYYAAYADVNGREAPLAIAMDERNILRKLVWAAEHSDDELTSKLSSGLTDYWLDSGNTAVALRYLPMGVSAAQRRASTSGDEDDIRRAHALTVTYGDALRMNDQLPAAERVLTQALQGSRQSGDKRNEGLALICLGLIQSTRGALDAAELYYRQARDCFGAIEDVRHEGEVERHLGEIAGVGRGQWDVADEHLQRALTIARNLKDTLGQGSVLNSLGEAEAQQRHWSAARDYYLQAITLLQQGRNIFEVSLALRALGEIAHAQGDWATAESYYQQSLLIRRERGDRAGESYVLTRLGELSQAQEMWSAAENYYRDALAIRTALDDQSGEADLFAYLGVLAHAQQRWTEASDYFKQSLERHQTLDDPHRQSVDLVWLGDIASAQHNWSAAESAYQQALALERVRGDQNRIALILTRYVDLAGEQQQWNVALAYFQQALTLDRSVAIQVDKSLHLHALGQAAAARKEWAAAEEYYQYALNFKAALDDQRSERVLLTLLGEVANEQKRWSSAETYYQRALVLDRSLNDQDGESIRLVWLGDVAKEQKQWNIAEDYFQQALALEQTRENRSRQGIILSRLGDLAQAQRQWQVAEGYFQQALTIQQDVGDTREAGIMVSKLAQAIEELGDLDRAEQLHRESLDMAIASDDSLGTADAWKILGAFLLTHTRDREEGERLLRQAFERYQQLDETEDAESVQTLAQEYRITIAPEE